jgi:hypothetical protein
MKYLIACFVACAAYAITVPFVITVGGDFTFTPLHTYFISPTGNDSCNGTSPASGSSGNCAWLTPSHTGLVCGDVILAKPGNYSSNGIGGFSNSPTNCPSTTGGIDGAGGIYFVTLLCAGTDLGTGGCNMNFTGGGWAFSVDADYWAIEGFTVTGLGGNGIFMGDGSQSTTVFHHIAFINNITYNVGIGFGGMDDGNATGGGVDYMAIVGNIAQNSQNNVICTASIVIVSPHEQDSVVQPHYIFYGNFAYYEPDNGCPYDQENFMFDTWDAYSPMVGSGVLLNNMGWSAWRSGFQYFPQFSGNISALTINLYNNTFFNDSLSNQNFGELNLQINNSTFYSTVNAYDNALLASHVGACGVVIGGSSGSTVMGVTMGVTGHENIILNSADSTANECLFQGATGGTNFYVNPNFNNTTDLLANRTTGNPNCTGFINTTACMGWEARTSTLTNPSVIYDLTPTCTQCTNKGYQKPSTTCVTSGTYHDLYPGWLKGVVYLQASGWVAGATITEKAGLVTKPCGL